MTKSVAAPLVVERVDAAGGVRDLQTGVLRLALRLKETNAARGFLLLNEPGIGDDRLRREWAVLRQVLRPQLVERIGVVVQREDEVAGISSEEHAAAFRRLATRTARQGRAGRSSAGRKRQADYWFFVILKLLLHRWVKGSGPIRMNALAEQAGCTYPTAARALKELGGLVERTSDRRARLRSFPRRDVARMAAVAPRIRRSLRFGDRSGQPRSAEAHLQRLRKMDVPDLAVGGVIAARHYHPPLDISGTPRLDVSVAASWDRQSRPFDALAEETMKRLDPALERLGDPSAPAIVVVHLVPHKLDLFETGNDGLPWADPIDCLLDLQEAGLGSVTTEFADFLTRRGEGVE